MPAGHAHPESSQSPSLRRTSALLGTLVALTVIGSSAVAVALPVLSDDLGLDTSGAAWVLAAFSLTFSISTPVFGRLADLYGLRLPLRIGSFLFAAGSLAAALAPSFGALIAARLVQGSGAGAVPVLVVGIIAARFDDSARTRALGGITAVVSVVSGSGPLIGGAITELLGWHFVLALPVIAVLVAEPVARLAPRTGRQSGSLDVRGALLVAATVTGGALLLQSPATGAGGRLALLFGGVLIAGLVLLAAHVRRRPAGFIPQTIVRNRPLMRSSLTGLTLLAAYIGLLFAVPKLLSIGFGMSPLAIGLAMLPAAAFGAIVSRLVGGRLTPAHRHRVVATLAAGSALGLLIGAVGAGVAPLLVLGLALSAAGFGGGQVALMDGIPDLVPAHQRGAALGIFNLLFFVGGTVGAAATGGLSIVLSLPAALACLAVLPFAGALLALRIGGGPGPEGQGAGDHPAPWQDGASP
jgi:MFS family permease